MSPAIAGLAHLAGRLPRVDALVTTFMTTPLLDRVYPEPLREKARQMSVAPAGDAGEQGKP
jgi:hypothetical protein